MQIVETIPKYLEKIISDMSCDPLHVTFHLPWPLSKLCLVRTALMVKPIEAMQPQRKKAFKQNCKAMAQYQDGHFENLAHNKSNIYYQTYIWLTGLHSNIQHD